MKGPWRVWIGLVVAAASPAAAAEPPAPDQTVLAKVSSHVVARTEGGGRAEFFVVLDGQADLSGAATLATKAEKGRHVYRVLRQAAEAAQAPIRAWLDARGIAYRPFHIVNALLIEGDRSLVTAMAARPEVARLEANPRVRAVPLPISPRMPAPDAQAVEPNIQQVRAPDVWAMGYTGQGVVVGIQDTGQQWDHPALKSQYRGWNGLTASHDYHWHDSVHGGGGVCGADAPAPCDDLGHGTHTAGTAVGGDGGTNQIGMAPGARWMGCRNMDQGVGSPATYLECFQFFLAPYPIGGTPADGVPELAPDVTVNSWACPPEEGCAVDTLQAAVEAQRAAGIMTVVAAGNEGGGCGTVAIPPSFYAAASSVGALNTGTDDLAAFSSRGPVTVDGSNRRKPDLVAPGTNVRSSVPPSGYTTHSGTSMAAPHVAGAAALLWSAMPGLIGDVDATEGRLYASAAAIASTQCGSDGSPNNLYGYGRLDALAAVLASTFVDVPTTHPFFAWIEALVGAGITGGCSASPPLYCPDGPVTRGHMAVFLLRGIYGGGYDPPAATGVVFADVSTMHPLAEWIERLAADGITTGCSTNPPQYCPDAGVTRGEMAVFLLRARHGPDYVPPDATGTVFDDVPAALGFAAWIEQLALEGITGGCAANPSRYCPDAIVTRGQMAVFLARAFGLVPP